MNKLLLFILLLMPLSLYAQDQQENDLSDASFPELSKSLESEFAKLKTAETQKDKKGEGRSLGNIGGIYLNIARQPSESVQQTNLISSEKKVNLKRSVEYSNKSIEVSEEVGDIEQLKRSYKNLNSAQKMQGNVKGAMASYAKLLSLKKTLLTSKKTDEIARKQLEYEHARREDSIRHQQQIAEEHVKEQALALAQQQQQLEATNKTLTNTQKEKENARNALQKTQKDLTIEKGAVEEKDRLLTIAEQEKALQAANLKLQQDQIQMKDEALERRKKERYFYIAGIVALFALSLLAFSSFRLQKKYNVTVVREKKRYEDLLLNILPLEVAGELMEKGFADAKHFEDVTVLFTDFISFTSVAETMSAKQLVGELHVCFKAFDDILGKYHIEKIKTVGDAYMAVSGLPVSNPNHAADVVAAAIEIRDFMQRRKVEIGSDTFSIRIGINSGNVVAGIVGVRKFSYDIWGDTVNIAARMEQNSEDGKINISETTYQLVKDKYGCIYRGKVEAKNKGSIDMYYLV